MAEVRYQSLTTRDKVEAITIMDTRVQWKSDYFDTYKF